MNRKQAIKADPILHPQAKLGANAFLETRVHTQKGGSGKGGKGGKSGKNGPKHGCFTASRMPCKISSILIPSEMESLVTRGGIPSAPQTKDYGDTVKSMSTTAPT